MASIDRIFYKRFLHAQLHALHNSPPPTQPAIGQVGDSREVRNYVVLNGLFSYFTVDGASDVNMKFILSIIVII